MKQSSQEKPFRDPLRYEKTRPWERFIPYNRMLKI